MIVLSKTERERFMAWLDQEIAESNLIMASLKSMKPSNQVTLSMKRTKAEVLAMILITAKLDTKAQV